MNNVVLIGRITRDIDLKFIPSTGLAVAKFSLAVDRGLYGEKKKEAEAKGLPTADFINITVFGKTAESCANYLNQGNKCAVQGRINTGSYTTQTGEKRYTTDVIADRVEFLSKKETSNAPGNSNHFDDSSLFEPVDNMDDVPF